MSPPPSALAHPTTPDAFTLLAQPRRPWLDPTALKSAFFEKSTPLHPDRIHDRPAEERAVATELYAELNGAHQRLQDIKERLALLLELETGSRPGQLQTASGETMDLFFRVGQLCRGADAFLAERVGITSPLLKARAFARGLQWTDQLQSLSSDIAARRATIEAELQELNASWLAAETQKLEGPARRMALPLARLETLYRDWGFLSRWSQQLQERIVRLAE